MSPESSSSSTTKRRRHRARDQECHCCRVTFPFCWSCRCGLRVCQACMDENRWGVTCNDITWKCPDCGRMNSYGNQ